MSNAVDPLNFDLFLNDLSHFILRRGRTPERNKLQGIKKIELSFLDKNASTTSTYEIKGVHWVTRGKNDENGKLKNMSRAQ